MEPIQFTLDKKPSKHKRAFLWALVFFCIYMGTVVYQGYQGIVFHSIVSFGISIAIYIFIIANGMKAIGSFSVCDKGIRTEKQMYEWSDFLEYHWLGESQTERLGIVRLGKKLGFDPINPFAGMDTKILRIRKKKNHFVPWAEYSGFLELLVSKDLAKELTEILQKNGIRKRSFFKQMFGSWQSGVLLILFFVVGFLAMMVIGWIRYRF